jgi:hypothetical protein
VEDETIKRVEEYGSSQKNLEGFKEIMKEKKKPLLRLPLRIPSKSAPRQPPGSFRSQYQNWHSPQ